MFDVRPARVADDLAMGKKLKLPKVVKLIGESWEVVRIKSNRKTTKAEKTDLSKIGLIQMNRFFGKIEAFPAYTEFRIKQTNRGQNNFSKIKEKTAIENAGKAKISYKFKAGGKQSAQDEKYTKFFLNDNLKSNKKKRIGKNQYFSDWVKKIDFSKAFHKPALGFAILALFIFSVIFSAKFVSYGWQKKEAIISKGMTAVNQLVQAKGEITNQNFQEAGRNIENARVSFEEAGDELDQIGGKLSYIFSKLPFLSKVSTGKGLLNAGKEISEAAGKLNQTILILNQMENPLSENNGKNIGDILINASGQIIESKNHLEKANEYFEEIKLADLPEQYQADFSKAKEALPKVIELTKGLEENYHFFYEILGYNGPRKYLFLFQNNQEIRATGGFIGSYGLLNIDNGKVEKLFIDGIFNPDGQLWEKVVPPEPIQKISAAWSTHDANWFPHFPTSAEKIAWFYEKTGGPTVDGIITITPTVMEKMLEVIGSVEMPEYKVTINKDNFIKETQYETEIDYDKELNQPKKIIADLTPKLFEKVFSSRDPQTISKTVKILREASKEKHILIYSFNHNIQEIISNHGWSGEILRTDKDYLMVVNSNINGFKTDGVINEQIAHTAEIQNDGSIINTVKIKRVHNGGNAEFSWWNKVNSNYMRVYVPKGSQLLDVKGHTREFNQPPLDYDALGFRRDPQVERERQNMKIDEENGTRVYEEENKTVFANWVYVSPQETVEIEYKYLLPFKMDFNKNKDQSDSYSILFQKQSGSIGSMLDFSLKYPDFSKAIWTYPSIKDQNNGNNLQFKEILSEDRFFGLVLAADNR